MTFIYINSRSLILWLYIHALCAVKNLRNMGELSPLAYPSKYNHFGDHHHHLRKLSCFFEERYFKYSENFHMKFR